MKVRTTSEEVEQDYCCCYKQALRKEQEFKKFIDEASKVATECTHKIMEKRLRKKRGFFDELTSDLVAERTEE